MEAKGKVSGSTMFTSFAMVIVFQTTAQALRNPEKFDQETRERMASFMDQLVKEGKSVILGDLMTDAVREGKEPNR